jgi:ribosome recycling factor
VAEDSRVAIRLVRRDANEIVKKALKDKIASEDETKKSETEIQKMTDDYIKKVDQIAEEKEKSILTI